jgi:hypothetical protein
MQPDYNIFLFLFSSNDLSGPEDGECDSADEGGEGGGGRKSADLGLPHSKSHHFRGGRIVPLPPPPPVAALFTSSQTEERGGGDFEAKAKGWWLDVILKGQSHEKVGEMRVEGDSLGSN